MILITSGVNERLLEVRAKLATPLTKVAFHELNNSHFLSELIRVVQIVLALSSYIVGHLTGGSKLVNHLLLVN